MSTVQELLDKTSRTFALAIPLLPEPTRTDVSLAYLVFRIVDTLEDAENLSPNERLIALEEVETLLEAPSAARASDLAHKWSALNLTDNRWYRQLLADTPLVFNELAHREPFIQRIILDNARRTAQGMASFLDHGGMQVQSLGELQRYCYFVAGIVGEMLSEVFAERIEAFSLTNDVRNDARAFGEGLQLINILKDADADARSGRVFLPEDVDDATIFNLARRDLQHAERYVHRLRHASAPHGYVAFTELPLRLGRATLDCVERCGPGSKVTRDQVVRILAGFAAEGRSSPPGQKALDRGNPRNGALVN